MGKSIIKAMIGAAILGAFSASSAVAADLVVKVDARAKSVAVTNMLPTKVTLLFLKAPDDMNLPVHAVLAKGATVKVPLRFEMPDGVTRGIGDVNDQRTDLSVEVIK